MENKNSSIDLIKGYNFLTIIKPKKYKDNYPYDINKINKFTFTKKEVDILIHELENTTPVDKKGGRSRGSIHIYEI